MDLYIGEGTKDVVGTIPTSKRSTDRLFVFGGGQYWSIDLDKLIDMLTCEQFPCHGAPESVSIELRCSLLNNIPNQ